MSVYVYVCVHVCLCMCMCVYMYVCVCVCVCTGMCQDCKPVRRELLPQSNAKVFFCQYRHL